MTSQQQPNILSPLTVVRGRRSKPHSTTAKGRLLQKLKFMAYCDKLLGLSSTSAPTIQTDIYMRGSILNQTNITGFRCHSPGVIIPITSAAADTGTASMLRGFSEIDNGDKQNLTGGRIETKLVTV
ncbi:hypothetical protein RRG08_012950 [Elysia crispata]|uniref:Uncharacterized protein n=1 Tax=Elysia crispata TaxID=231223 RepID=A0AAE1A1B2_9GAST|nr:hypothetical protein RRG08_012950 [Elysia crispata]